MFPTISANSYLIFHHLVFRSLINVGRIIKVQHPIYGLIVKRVTCIDQQGFYWLEGLNKRSVSCTQMGAITLQMITGVMVFKINP